MTVNQIHKDLVEGCRKKDKKAQIRIYELYCKAMYNASYRIVNNSFEAEDIMQESFIDAFNKIDTYQGIGTFGSWLKKIVINKSLDHLKKSKPEFTEIDEEHNLFEENNDIDDSSAEYAFYKMELISEALYKLPDNYRIIVSLYLLEGYDHQEISEILNISYNNVRTRYSRAKQNLINLVNELNDSYTNTIRN